MTSSLRRRDPSDTRMRAHEHAWCTQSRHRTSSGEVVYVRCAECGAHRVDLRGRDGMPPVALSVEMALHGS